MKNQFSLKMKLNKFYQLVFFFLIFTLNVLSQTAESEAGAGTGTGAGTDNPNVKKIIKYKAYETYDFESMVLKGSLVSPGDISSKIGNLREFDFQEKVRKNFDKKMVEETFEVY